MIGHVLKRVIRSALPKVEKITKTLDSTNFLKESGTKLTFLGEYIPLPLKSKILGFTIMSLIVMGLLKKKVKL